MILYTNGDAIKVQKLGYGVKKIFVFDYDVESGSLLNRRVLFEVTDGVPDGMTIDAEDQLWLAVWAFVVNTMGAFSAVGRM